MTEATFLDYLQQHQRIVHSVCRLYAETPTDRDDLFQEIVLQAWRSAAQYRGTAKFSTWLYQIALHTAISQYRRAERRPLHGELRPGVDLPEEAESDSEVEALYQAIGRLGKIDKAIVMLYLEDYDYAGIGAILGITPNHVAVKMSRIKARLKETIQQFI